MIAVSWHNRDNIKGSVVATVEDDNIEGAVELARGVVAHNRVWCHVYLINKTSDKPMLLRRVRRNLMGKVVVN